jgi:flagellin
MHRLRELSVQSANGIYSDEDRMQIQVEVSQLVDEVNRIASHAQFNGMNMLTGKFATDGPGKMYFQIGANMDQRKQVFIGAMTAEALGIQAAQGGAGTISISTPDQANRAIGMVDAALTVISKQRADLGAYQNRFEMAAKGVATASENMQASESMIRDANMASEMVNYVKNSILVQSATAMLAQANVQPRSVLQLLS